MFFLWKRRTVTSRILLVAHVVKIKTREFDDGVSGMR
jgi:hypothetical protein